MRLSRASRGIDRGLCEFAVAIPPRLLRNVTPFARARERESVLHERFARDGLARVRGGHRGGGGLTRVETCNFSVYISYKRRRRVRFF